MVRFGIESTKPINTMKNILLILLLCPLLALSQKRVDQLPEIETPTGTDVAVTVRGGSFYQTTFANLRSYFNATSLDSLVVSNDTIFAYMPGGGNVFAVLPDASSTNEIQTISKDGSTVTLSNGGGSFTDAVDDADASTSNEIQDISTDDSPGNITLSSGSTLTLNVDDDDASTSNELQTLSFSNPNLSISSGNSVDLSALSGGGGGTSSILHNIDSLKAYSSPTNDLLLRVSGYYDYNDGGGGLFWYDSDNSTSDNGGTVIAPTYAGFGGTGRWLRVDEAANAALSALSFGMVGDGSTDNETEWGNLVAEAIATDKDIFIPGTASGFLIGGTASTLDWSNITVFGEGDESLLVVDGLSNADGTIFKLATGTDQFRVQDIKMHCDNNQNPGIGEGGYINASGTVGSPVVLGEIFIIDVTMTADNEAALGNVGSSGICFFADDGSASTISNLVVKDCNINLPGRNNYGIVTEFTASRGTIETNYISLGEWAQNDANVQSFNAIAVYGSSKNVVVSKNVIEGSGHSAIAFSSGSSGTIVFNKIKNVLAINESGVEAEWKTTHNNDSTSYNLVIQGNETSNCHFGVFVTIRDTTDSPSYFSPPHDISIIDHTSTDDIKAGIVCQQNGTGDPWGGDSYDIYNISISNPRITGVVDGGESSGAIRLRGVNNVTITNPIITDVAGNGIGLGRDTDFKTRNISITGGYIKDPGRHCIEIKGAEESLTITGVTFDGGVEEQVFAWTTVYESLDVVGISNCTFLNGAKSGFYARGITGALALTVTGCRFYNFTTAGRPLDTNIAGAVVVGNVFKTYSTAPRVDGTNAKFDTIMNNHLDNT